MASNFQTGDKHDQYEENSGRQSNRGAGDPDGTKASDLPPNIKAIQEYFRPRFEAQDRRMEALAAAHFAAGLEKAKVTHDLPIDEALKLLERVANSEGEWPV